MKRVIFQGERPVCGNQAEKSTKGRNAGILKELEGSCQRGLGIEGEGDPRKESLQNACKILIPARKEGLKELWKWGKLEHENRGRLDLKKTRKRKRGA